jgi:hypothetical protein
MLAVMPGSSSEVTGDQVNRPIAGSTPTLVVERFLDHLRAGDIDAASELLGVDVEYTNVSLPTLHGRKNESSRPPTALLALAPVGKHAGDTGLCFRKNQ